jgi:hypothetical protein
MTSCRSLLFLSAVACVLVACGSGSHATETDAGDAGRMELDGAEDAGSIDAGFCYLLDAGPGDAGEQDAGEEDAGHVDAGHGHADAGHADAGHIDAGHLDAGPIDAGSPDAGPMCGVDGGFFPEFNKLCTSANDCAFGLHQVDCCGNLLAIGFNKSQTAAFNAAEATCDPMYPHCFCASALRAEDGEVASGPQSIAVRCDGCQCVTYVH